MVQTEQPSAPAGNNWRQMRSAEDAANWQAEHLGELDRLTDKTLAMMQHDTVDKKLRLARDVVLESIRQSPMVLLQHQPDSVKALVEASAKHLKNFIESP